jgi:aspartate kinase
MLYSTCFDYSLGVKVEMLSQGASKVNISLVVPMKDKELLIKSLHACFFEGKLPEECGL